MYASVGKANASDLNNNYILSPVPNIDSRKFYQVGAEIQFYTDTPQITAGDSFKYVNLTTLATTTITFSGDVFVQSIGELMSVINIANFDEFGSYKIQFLRNIQNHSKIQIINNDTSDNYEMIVESEDIRRAFGCSVLTVLRKETTHLLTNPYDLIKVKQYYFIISRGEENNVDGRRILAIVSNPYQSRSIINHQSRFTFTLAGYQLHTLGKLRIEDENTNLIDIHNEPIITLNFRELAPIGD